jgi:hypothetical protein
MAVFGRVGSDGLFFPTERELLLAPWSLPGASFLFPLLCTTADISGSTQWCIFFLCGFGYFLDLCFAQILGCVRSFQALITHSLTLRILPDF